MVHLPLPRKAGKSVADIAQVAPRSGEDARRAAGRRCRRGIAHEGEVALQQGKPAHDVIDDGDGAAALAKGRAAKDGKGLGHEALLTVFLMRALQNAKRLRVLKTAVRQRAYSPEGSCISPHPEP